MKSTKIFVIVLILLIIIAGGLFALKILGTMENTEATNTSADANLANQGNEQELSTPKTLSGAERPIAVMIDNHIDAMPQAGLLEADIVYEIIVEGGETRLMALFKGADIEEIGPVRSARHYFLDYAMENDAIYVHFGWSPQAKSDITKYSIHNINGISEDGTTFWRTNKKSAPHNAMTSTEKILQSAKNKNYRTTSDKKSVLQYTTDEVNLNTGEDATTVIIPHSDLQTVKYEYDSQNKVYKRYARNKEQTDLQTGEILTTKNIIITMCDNQDISDSDNKGRQTIKNIGTYDGYYITNGKAIKIKCTKQARDEKTVYTDLQGNIIEVNDGNTFVHICPTDSNVVIEGSEDEGATTSSNTVN